MKDAVEKGAIPGETRMRMVHEKWASAVRKIGVLFDERVCNLHSIQGGSGRVGTLET